MTRRRSVEARNEPEPSSAATPGAAAVLVPRAWLIVLAAILLVPWIIAAALYRGTTERVAASAPAAPAAPAGSRLGAEGPWGRLEISPIVISPPLEYLPADPDPPQQVVWRFPRTTQARLEEFLGAAGLSADRIAALRARTRAEPGIGGLVVSPDPDIVWTLPADTRARISLALAASEVNPRHQDAFRFLGPSADAWLGPARLPPAVIDLVRPLTFQHDGFTYFADIDLVRMRMGDTPEFRRLTKALLSEATFVVRVQLGSASAVDAAAEYWGRGGRRTDIRPLLESVAALGPGAALDVTHLLPAFARDHLYRYPQISLADFEKPSLTNCFWTSLNFFNARPDDRFLEMKAVLDTIKRDYHLVHDNFQLGDIVVFADRDGNFYHAAVHVADGLVFGKNGNSSLSPWTLLPVERIRGYYPQHAATGSISRYRRNDM